MGLKFNVFLKIRKKKKKEKCPFCGAIYEVIYLKTWDTYKVKHLGGNTYDCLGDSANIFPTKQKALDAIWNRVCD